MARKFERKTLGETVTVAKLQENGSDGASCGGTVRGYELSLGSLNAYQLKLLL